MEISWQFFHRFREVNFFLLGREFPTSVRAVFARILRLPRRASIQLILYPTSVKDPHAQIFTENLAPRSLQSGSGGTKRIFLSGGKAARPVMNIQSHGQAPAYRRQAWSHSTAPVGRHLPSRVGTGRTPDGAFRHGPKAVVSCCRDERGALKGRSYRFYEALRGSYNN